MPRRLMWRVFQVGNLVAIVAMTAVLAGAASAQDKVAAKGEAKATTDTAASAGKKATAKKARKPSVRMPAYYGDVVDPSQREKIRLILGEFNVKINDLKAQLDTLTKERDAKVAAVLTPEQAKKIEGLKAAARAKRAAGKQTDSKKPAKSRKKSTTTAKQADVQ